jgi:hypothetical protein
MKVIVPLKVTEGAPIRSMFPPVANVTGPPSEKKMTISPGPNPLTIVVIGVVDVFKPTEWIPFMFMAVAGFIWGVRPTWRKCCLSRITM